MGVPPLLLRRWPGLTHRYPHVSLCDLPTPLHRMDGASDEFDTEVWIKRDDLTARPYGGNKVRKLEFLLGDLMRNGVGEVITTGYTGSNHATATALHAARLGVHTTSLLVPQPTLSEHGWLNLLAQHAVGTELVEVAGFGTARRLALRRQARSPRRGGRPRWIPAGGSNELGTAGFVNAGLELADQIDAGLAPKPSRVYVAASTAGTGAGLLLGLTAAGLSDVELHLVAVAGPEMIDRDRVVKRAAFAWDRLRDASDTVPDIGLTELPWRVRSDFIGPAYGIPTPWATHAADVAALRDGIELDPVYSSKAFAALAADARGRELDGPVLFWNTFNSAPMAPLVDGVDPAELPDAFRALQPGPPRG